MEYELSLIPANRCNISSRKSLSAFSLAEKGFLSMAYAAEAGMGVPFTSQSFVLKFVKKEVKKLLLAPIAKDAL